MKTKSKKIATYQVEISEITTYTIYLKSKSKKIVLEKIKNGLKKEGIHYIDDTKGISSKSHPTKEKVMSIKKIKNNQIDMLN